MLILPGLSPVIGSTEAEAQRIARELNDLSDPEVGTQALCPAGSAGMISHTCRWIKPYRRKTFPILLWWKRLAAAPK